MTAITAAAINKTGRTTLAIQGCTVEISACFGNCFSVVVRNPNKMTKGGTYYNRKRDLSMSRVVVVAETLLADALS